jgi:hypothetical protein
MSGRLQGLTLVSENNINDATHKWCPTSISHKGQMDYSFKGYVVRTSISILDMEDRLHKK